MTTWASSHVEGSSRSHGGTPRKVTSGPYIAPKRVIESPLHHAEPAAGSTVAVRRNTDTRRTGSLPGEDVRGSEYTCAGGCLPAADAAAPAQILTALRYYRYGR